MPLLGSVLALHFIKIVFPLPLEKQVLKYSLLYYLVPFSLWAVHTRPWVLKSHAAVLCLVTQLCLILCNLMDCSPPGCGAGPILTTHNISELCVLLFVALFVICCFFVVIIACVIFSVEFLAVL